MLTLVFACQPIGQLAATLVALIAVVRQRNGIPSDALIGQCNMECKKTLDSVWRWILGVGVIPAVIALWFRLTIIESPRYTADVERDSNKAATELESYLLIKSQPILSATSSSISLDQAQGAQENYRMRRGSSGAASGVASDAGSGIASGAASILEENHTQQTGENPQHGFKNNHIAITHLPLRNPTSQNQQSPRIVPNGSHNPPLWLHQESLAGLQGENFEHNELPPVPSWREFKDHFWHAGNLRTLLATSFCWFCTYPFIVFNCRLDSRVNTCRCGPPFLWPWNEFSQNNYHNLVRKNPACRDYLSTVDSQRLAITRGRISRGLGRLCHYFCLHRQARKKDDTNDRIFLAVHTVYCHWRQFQSSG